MEILTSSQIVQSVLVCTLERFADQVGVSFDTARGWVNRGYLPTYRIGKYSLVNLAQFNQELLNSNKGE